MTRIRMVAVGLAALAGVWTVQASTEKEVAVREGVGNFTAKAVRGEKVTVAYLGGSITSMNGWRNLTTDWLGTEFPKTKVKEIHASIGGTGSDLGVFRLEHDALRYNPDLLFVEFATNDGSRPADAIIRQMEGIVRQTWAKDPKTDIVFAYTFTQYAVKAYQNGDVQSSVKAMERVAAHYGIPSVNFGYRVMDELHAGRLVISMKEVETAVPQETPERDQQIAAELAKEGKILFSKDGVHPALPGHEFYLKSVQNLFAAAKGKAAADHAAKMAAAPLDANHLQNAKMVDITEKMLVGTWGKSEKMNRNKVFVKRVDEVWETLEAGAKLKFTFDGSHCRIYDIVGPNGGQVWITVDGQRKAKPLPRFDSYCTYYRMQNFPVFDGAPGRHTVEIEVDAEQPDRQPVAFRLKNPKKELAAPKYNGTGFWPCKILIVGDICD